MTLCKNLSNLLVSSLFSQCLRSNVGKTLWVKFLTLLRKKKSISQQTLLLSFLWEMGQDASPVFFWKNRKTRILGSQVLEWKYQDKAYFYHHTPIITATSLQLIREACSACSKLHKAQQCHLSSEKYLKYSETICLTILQKPRNVARIYLPLSHLLFENYQHQSFSSPCHNFIIYHIALIQNPVFLTTFLPLLKRSLKSRVFWRNILWNWARQLSILIPVVGYICCKKLSSWIVTTLAYEYKDKCIDCC